MRQRSDELTTCPVPPGSNPSSLLLKRGGSRRKLVCSSWTGTHRYSYSAGEQLTIGCGVILIATAAVDGNPDMSHDVMRLFR